MILITIIFLALIIGSISAFVIITGRKTGLFDHLQARFWPWFPWSCNFCFGFWLSLAFSVVYWSFEYGLLVPFPMLLVPMIAAVFNNMFLK